MNDNTKSTKISKTTLFTTALLSSLTIQLFAQGAYPTFDNTIESKAQAAAIYNRAAQ